MKNYELLKDLELTLKIRLAKKKIMYQDLKQFNAGTIIRFDNRSKDFDKVEIIFKDRSIANGYIVTVGDGNFWIKINEVLRSPMVK